MLTADPGEDVWIILSLKSRRRKILIKSDYKRLKRIFTHSCRQIIETYNDDDTKTILSTGGLIAGSRYGGVPKIASSRLRKMSLHVIIFTKMP